MRLWFLLNSAALYPHIRDLEASVKLWWYNNDDFLPTCHCKSCQMWWLKLNSHVSDVQVSQAAGYSSHLTFPHNLASQQNIQTLTQQHAIRQQSRALYPNNSPSFAMYPNNSSMHQMLQLQGQYSQNPPLNHNSFAFEFHGNSPGLNIQQPLYTTNPVNRPFASYQSMLSSQMSKAANYQCNPFGVGPPPSQPYSVPYGMGLSSSDTSGFLQLNQQSAYQRTSDQSSLSASLPDATVGQLRSSSDNSTDASSRYSESVYNAYKIWYH